VKSIEGFANGMKIKTVAEFVSSQEIFDAVNALGIDYSQGFFIAKPKPDTKPDVFT
jgi:EAL domain-containing protein (putative c-di-GMP-specific phosphodiesterase class I)